MLATHYKFVTIVIYIVMFVVETARLYLGYEGNLREKVIKILRLVHTEILIVYGCVVVENWYLVHAASGS